MHLLRRLAGVFVLFLAFAAGAITLGPVLAQVVDGPEVTNCVEVPEHGKALCDLVETTTTTTAPTTTTTEATTTTTQPTTTTTDPRCATEPSHPACPSTTTTTSPTTTTTAPPSSLVIPATQEYPGGLNEGEGFRFMIGCAQAVQDRPDDPVPLDCPETSSGGLEYVTFDYVGHGMPYLYSEAMEGNHDHGWWQAGDREGYQCSYGFMYDKKPPPIFGHDTIIRQPHEGIFIHRATIVRPEGNGYGKINDTYMEEGQRYYDGSVANEGGQEISEPCQSTALDPDFDYEAYVPTEAQDIRVGLFRADGEIADIRDFTQAEIAVDPSGEPMGHFEFVSLIDGRVTIVFILHDNQKVSHVFYYDVLGDAPYTGRLAVEVNGVVVAEG